MARPTQPKEVKPKALEAVEDGAPAAPKEGFNLMNTIITAVIIILSTSLSSAASMYFLAPIILKPMLSHISVGAGEGGEGGGEHAAEGGGEGGAAAPTVGPVLALDEFTVNLKDPGKERYLRASISLTVSANDPKYEKLAGEAAKKWDEEFHGEMAPYVPAIRDIIISALTKRTAAELSTPIGKQEVKDEVKRGAEALFQGKRQVIRVNLENFIIQ